MTGSTYNITRVDAFQCLYDHPDFFFCTQSGVNDQYGLPLDPAQPAGTVKIFAGYDPIADLDPEFFGQFLKLIQKDPVFHWKILCPSDGLVM